LRKSSTIIRNLVSKFILQRILLFRELGGLGIGFLKESIDLNKESSPSLEDCLKEITDFNKESPPKELSS